MTTEFGPAHKCRRCGVEMQLVQRSFGRSAFEEIATGRNHRYYCAVRNAETAAMIAALREPEYMDEKPEPALPVEQRVASPKPKAERPPWSIR